MRSVNTLFNGDRMEIKINITSEEAQNILKGLSYLCKQTGLQPEIQQQITELGSRLSKTFGKVFEWRFGIGKASDVFNHYLTKKINIRLKN